MKLRFLCLLLIGLVATSTFGATIGAWIQDPCEGTMSGNFTNPAMWKSSSNARPPNPTTNTGDEIKFNTPTAKSTINTDLANYNCKFTVAAGTNSLDVHTILIQSGAVVDTAQFQVGHGSSTDKGQWGLVNQSGGTVSAEKLMLGMYGTRGVAHGQYIISGGTLQSNSGLTTNTGRLMVGGCASNGTSANNEGIFTVIGSASTISMKELYVGGYTTFVGKGTLQFKADVDGVTPITVSSSVTLDAGAANSNAVLLVENGFDYHGTLILVQNTGTGLVSGLFDTINGVAATEGAQVTLGGNLYTLTYVYDADGDDANNDIALIPEPATIALLSLGLIAIRRKK